MRNRKRRSAQSGYARNKRQNASSSSSFPPSSASTSSSPPPSRSPSSSSSSSIRSPLPNGRNETRSKRRRTFLADLQCINLSPVNKQSECVSVPYQHDLVHDAHATQGDQSLFPTLPDVPSTIRTYYPSQSSTSLSNGSSSNGQQSSDDLYWTKSLRQASTPFPVSLQDWIKLQNDIQHISSDQLTLRQLIMTIQERLSRQEELYDQLFEMVSGYDNTKDDDEHKQKDMVSFFCKPLFDVKLYPTKEELEGLATKALRLESSGGFAGHLTRKVTLSEVKKWFRKKRDIFAQRVFGHARRYYESRIKNGLDVEKEIQALSRPQARSHESVEHICRSLGTENKDDYIHFIIAKLIFYLKNTHPGKN